MTLDRWRRVDELFHKAAEMNPADRAAFLERECGGDSDLLREVDTLLAAEPQGSDVLAAAVGQAIQSVETTISEAEVGRRIGPYRVIREIGRGGMGTVYLAARDDDEFRKEVTLKVVRRGMDTDAVLNRFRQERQILAQLEHPNIARLLDGGTTDDGLPYLVMEYVRGTPIDVYANQRGLRLAQRLALVRQLCEALQYAHQNLVVHRDLKPENILVADDGSPRLVDFGIAKLLEPGLPTVTVAGISAGLTPDYASPEQVRGEPITTATDVYSLGTVVYELITGVKAHRLTAYTPREIERVICEDELPKPGTVASGQRLPRDLDIIVLKAMHKDPRRRYPSMEQLSEDLRRFLEAKPIRARADTFLYRAGKFVSRNKAAVAAALAVAVSLTTGTLIANQQARRAERRFDQVRKLANSLVFEVHDAIRDLPGATRARQTVINRAIEYLDQLASEAGGDRTLQAELASAYQRIGEVQGKMLGANLGDPKSALASFGKARAIQEVLVQAGVPGARLGFVRTLIHTGDVLSYTGKLGEALHSFDRAISEAAAIEEDAALFALARAHAGKARVEGDMGRNSDSMASYRKALDSYERLERTHPNSKEARAGLASALRGIGRMEGRGGDPAAALRTYRRALAVQEALVAEDPTNIDQRRNLMFSYSHVADTLGNPSFSNLGDPAGALANYRKVVEVAEFLYKADPSDKRAKADYAIALMRVANTTPDSDVDTAIRAMRRSAEVLEEASRGDPTNSRVQMNLVYTYNRIGDRETKAGRLQGAAQSLRQSIALGERAVEKDPKDVATRRILAGSLSDYGALLARDGRHDEGLAYTRKAVLHAEECLKADAAVFTNAMLRPRSLGWLGAAFVARAMSPRATNAERLSGLREGASWLQKSVDAWKPLEKYPEFAQNYRAERDRSAAELDKCLALLK